MAARIGRPMRARLVPNLLHTERTLDRDLLEAMRDRFGSGVSPHPIRDHVEIREATAFGRAVIEHAPESEASADYRRLAAWIETESATVIEPPEVEAEPSAEDRSDVDSASPTLGDDSGVREVEISGRAAELVGRLRPGGGARPAAPIRPDANRVRIVQPAMLGGHIAVTGDFNQWHEAGLPLRPIEGHPGGDRWVGIELPVAGSVRYRLVVDGRTMLDPANPHVAEGPDGRPASVLMIEPTTSGAPSASPTFVDLGTAGGGGTLST
jgi:hypothetical protein